MISKAPSLPIFEGWRFTPEGAALHSEECTAVIADLHLGYEWARAAAGDCVVAHSLEETLGRLSALLSRAPVSRLIVAGDLLESARPCPDTARDLTRLKSWLADRDVNLLLLEGNHDVSVSLSARRLSNRSPATCVVAGWTIGHGHQPIPGPARISRASSSRFSLARNFRSMLPRWHRSNHVASVFAKRGRLQRRYRLAAKALARRFPALPGQHRRRSPRFWTAGRPAPQAASPRFLI